MACQGDHSGLQVIDHRSDLFPRAAVRLVNGHDLPCLLFLYLGEGRVDILIQLPCRIIGHFQLRESFLSCVTGRTPKAMASVTRARKSHFKGT
jgi:hypothetical protein